MSLVGPRMLGDVELARFGEYGDKVLSVKPGMAGLWVANGRHTLSFERRVELEADGVNIRYREAAANIVRFAELEAVLSALTHVGVEAIVLKGAALAGTVYPNVAERPMGDVDLLVRRLQLGLAHRCMLDLGYETSEANSERIGPFQVYTTGEKGYHRQLGQFNLVFELHWQLSSVEAYSRIDIESLWAERRLLQVGGAEGWQLSPRDTLMHVCVHLASHGFSHAVASADIKQVITRPDFSWEPFLERVARFRVKRAVYYALLPASKTVNAGKINLCAACSTGEQGALPGEIIP